jgi:phosphatidyl-myo-inositol dimannoside synthase
MKVVFLSLKGFAGIGGIEKVNRLVMRVMTDLLEAKTISQLNSISAYDREPDVRYIAADNFTGFGGNRLSFSIAAVTAGIKCDIVILSHINLAPVGLAIKALHPSVNMLLIAHGIEIWPEQRFIKKQFLLRCDRILAISKFTKDAIVDKNNIPAEQITVLHNGIDPFLKVPAHFGKPANLLERYGLKNHDSVLLTLTRMSAFEKFKGYDRVIQAVAQLKSQFPQLRYLLAGKCDEGERKRLEELIRSLGVENQVILTGFVREEELSAHFLLGDIFIMPSKKEGFGIVFIEALACGMTVIAGNKDGSVDAIRYGEWGLLTDPDNTDEIQAAIVKGLYLAQQQTEENKRQRSEDVLKEFGFRAYRRHWQRVLEEVGTYAHP